MPPKVRFKKAAVLDAAFHITRTHGLDALNARDIARELGCSTQPLFRDFSGMEDIRREMMRMAMDCYNGYIQRSPSLSDKPYKGTGLAYILFAKEEPELFRLLFMRDRLQDGSSKDSDEENIDYILDVIGKATGLPPEQALRFHRELWIFTHGLAVMVATKYIAYDADLIDKLLTDQFWAIKNLFSQKQLSEP